MSFSFLEKVREKPTMLWEQIRESRPAQSLIKTYALSQRHWFLTQVLLIFLFRASLDLVYVVVVAPVFGYTGFTLSIDPLFYLCTWLALLVVMPLIIRLSDQREPSTLMVTFLNYLFFIPMTSYCGCYGSDVTFFLIGLVYWAVLLFFQFCLPILHLRCPALKNSKPFMVILTVCACLLVLFISGRYTGFRFTLNFLDVYGIRSEAAAYAIPTPFSYLLSMMPIVLALALLYWMERKKWLVVAAVMVVFLFLFSIDAQKSIFFLLLLVLLCRFLYRDWMLRWAPGLLSLFSIAAVLENIIINSYYLTSFFVHRIMYIPVQICERYYHFFHENPQNLFREGIMGKFGFDSLYSIRIPLIIGEYGGTPQGGANGGLLADLFANAPLFPGIVILPLILVVCFRLMDLIGSAYRTRIILPLCLYFALMFISAFWSTVLLTNGFLLTCLILYIYPHEEGLDHV